MTDATTTIILPHYGSQEFDLVKLNDAITAVVEYATEEAGRYALVHSHGWSAEVAVTYARAAQFCCDNSIDLNHLVGPQALPPNVEIPYDRSDPVHELLATAPREATALRQHLIDAGYIILPVPREGEPLYGVPAWDAPESLLMQYTTWLASQGQLVAAPAGVNDDNEDMVLHFLADQREAAREAP